VLGDLVGCDTGTPAERVKGERTFTSDCEPIQLHWMVRVPEVGVVRKELSRGKPVVEL
jgi:hypothetical protein